MSSSIVPYGPPMVMSPAEIALSDTARESTLTRDELEWLPYLDSNQVATLRLLAESIGSDLGVAKRLMDYSRFAPWGCVLFVGGIDGGGYGVFHVMRNGRKVSDKAHRVSHRTFWGPIPDGLTVDHLCRNRRCIHPGHLEAVDHQTNILRSNGLAARNAAMTHCKNGHEFTPENTRVHRNMRRCITCRREYDQAYRRRSERP